MRVKKMKFAIRFMVIAFLLAGSAGYAANIDPDGIGQKYVFGGNVGWLVFVPTAQAGATMDEGIVRGYLWSENLGWVKLNWDDTHSVKLDAHGNLSGLAWSENAGWINFSCKTLDSCFDSAAGTGVDYGVKIDTVTGKIKGYAWGENIGWIKFDYEGFVGAENTHAVTSWRMNGDVNSDGIVDLDDLIVLSQLGSDVDPATTVYSGADIDGDGKVTIEEFLYILQYLAGFRPIDAPE